MPLSAKRVYFRDYTFDVWENVYEPAEDSFLFAENIDVQEAETVLDVGTGCGILGILAAEKASAVVSVDVNPYAIRCAKENAKLNDLQSKSYYVQGDLFTPLSESSKFDLVLFNAPYLPADEDEMESWIGRAWAGGATGRQVIDRFIVEAPKYLKDKGRVLLMQSTLAGVDETLRRFADYGMSGRVVAECALPLFETIKLVEAKI
jgi:release factor glutamine methyltransferase